MKSTLTRRHMLKLASTSAAALIAAPSMLRADANYPSRPINVIVPFKAGGYNDRLARAFAPFLQEKLGQPVNIINKGGAGALLGHSYFLQQPDDGYTILCTSAAPYLPLNVLLQDAPFKVSDFQMINLPSQDYTLLATGKDSGITSIDDVIARLKADNTSLSIGLQPASADLVNLMLLMDMNGISREGLRLVTFDGGGPARNAVAGNVVDIALVGGQGFLPLVEQITPLLTFDTEVQDGWGGKLITDLGGADAEFVYGSQRGWAVHSSMMTSNPDVYAKITTAIEAASKDPAAIEALTSQQLATQWRGPEASNKALADTSKVMAQYVDLLKGA